MEEKTNNNFLSHALVVLSFGFLFFSPSLFAAASAIEGVSDVTMLNSKSEAKGEFIFSPRTRQWRAIDANGKVVRTGYGSGGRNYCPDIHRPCRTPSGTYTVLAKGGAGCRSSRYPVGRGGAPMPYCMYFSQYYAVHGSYEVPNWNASHGCIRIQPSDARWLSNHFMHVGTKIVVKPY